MKHAIWRRTAVCLIAALWGLAAFCAVPGAAADGSTVSLTLAEQAYVQDNPTISIAMDTSWVPYAMDSDDAQTVVGTIPNLLNEVAAAVGLRVEYVAQDSYADAVATVQSGETQLVSGIADDPAMASKSQLWRTDPYIQITYCAVTQSKIQNLYAAGNASRVAVCVGSYSTMAMRQKMPSYDFVEYRSNQECIDAVLRGEADMALVATYSAEYYMGWHQYAGLNSILISDFSWGLCFGVEKSCDPRLISILNKGIAALDENDVNQAIYSSLVDAANSRQSWSELLYDHPLPAMALAAGAAALVLLCGGLFLGRRKKALELQRQQQLNQELQRANQAKGEFLSRMSHDLRTPMNAVVGLAGLGAEEAREPESRTYFQKILASSQYLLGLLNDILNMSRIEAGEVLLREAPVDVHRHLAEIISLVQPLLDQRSIRLETDFSGVTEPYLRYDKLRVQQVIVNILSNAIKFSPPDSVIQWQIRCLERTAGRMTLEYTVQDHGCGISPDFLPRIFQPFEQESNVYSSQTAGTGLGLAICKSLVERMGGTIQAESQPGSGSTFTVQLSFAVCTPPEAQSAESAPQAISLDGVHILLCEDHPLNTEIAKKLLERKGAAVDCVENGAAALERFTASAPGGYDVILMDIRMPVMNGLDATRAIRALDRPDAKTVPIVAMTANVYDTDRAHSRAAGMNAHLAKPIDPAVLYRTIDQLLSPPAEPQ